MAKRDEAFELFSQGKMPSDPEVVALGLKSKTTTSYFRDWKKLQPEPEAPEVPSPVPSELPVVVAPPSEMPVKDVANGGLFECVGNLYKKKLTVYSGQVIAVLMFKAHYTNVLKEERGPVEFKPDVLVTPK